jgi:hypothetical protein
VSQVILYCKSIKRSSCYFCAEICILWSYHGRSQLPRGLRRKSAAAHLLGSWVRTPPGAWMFVSGTMFILSGLLCDGPIPRPEESYRLCCVFECDQVKTLYTCCEQVGRRVKGYETKSYHGCSMCLECAVCFPFCLELSLYVQLGASTFEPCVSL